MWIFEYYIHGTCGKPLLSIYLFIRHCIQINRGFSSARKIFRIGKASAAMLRISRVQNRKLYYSDFTSASTRIAKKEKPYLGKNCGKSGKSDGVGFPQRSSDTLLPLPAFGIWIECNFMHMNVKMVDVRNELYYIVFSVRCWFVCSMFSAKVFKLAF